MGVPGIAIASVLVVNAGFNVYILYNYPDLHAMYLANAARSVHCTQAQSLLLRVVLRNEMTCLCIILQRGSLPGW